MDDLNYHHLQYFHAVVKAGGVAEAARRLGVSQPTLSVQVKQLERRLGERLMTRVGRRLELTDTGRLVFEYADEIFGLGVEMINTLLGRAVDRPRRLVIGVTDVLPKLIVSRLLEPVFRQNDDIHVVCTEGPPEQLLAELTRFDLDAVVADEPMTSASRPRVFSRAIGECGVAVMAAPRIARMVRPGFPASLTGADWLLPLRPTALRAAVDQWLEPAGITPRIRGEFADSSLMKVIAAAGEGVFPVPAAIEADVARTYGMEVVGRLPDARLRFYMISAERKIKHPAILLMTEAAGSNLFNR
jgi:LysR family transcriptional activator of nhaA